MLGTLNTVEKLNNIPIKVKFIANLPRVKVNKVNKMQIILIVDCCVLFLNALMRNQ